MCELVNEIKLSKDEISDFNEGGVIKLNGIFTSSAIDKFSGIVRDEYDDEKPLMGDKFSRINYDIANDEQHVLNICKSQSFKRIINSLIDERIIFTQNLYFELEQEKSKGFDWHFGLLSFNFIKPTDMAYTIWIPLDEIDVEGQRGGMAYIPETDYSAKEDSKKTAKLYELVNKDVLDKEKFLGDSDIFQGANSGMFNSICKEDSFKLGDALIFNRYVWHKSIPLFSGELQKRRAFVMRFISSKSTYNRSLFDAATKIGHNMYSNFGETFKDINEGDLIINSQYSSSLV